MLHAPGFVHVLGDAFPILTDPCLGLSTTYPWACTFAGTAVLIIFTLEFGATLAPCRFSQPAHSMRGCPLPPTIMLLAVCGV